MITDNYLIILLLLKYNFFTYKFQLYLTTFYIVVENIVRQFVYT